MYQNVYLNRKGYNQYDVHLWDSEKGYLCFEWEKPAFVPAFGGEYKTLNGKSVKKVRNWDSSMETYEADLPVETSLLVELYEEDDEPATHQRMLIFDIEVSMEPELPDVDIANNEITSISYYDSVLDEYGVFINDEFDEVTNNVDIEYTIHKCNGEKDLLRKFLNKWEEINPTIVTGWYVDDFDIPYLYRRLVKLFGENEANRLSSIGVVYWHKRRQRYFIAGVSCLDYFPLYKNFTYTQMSNYRLDTVGGKELGYGKIEYEGSLDDLKRNNIEKFIEYNIVDTKIVKELEDKLKFIELAIGICHVGHVPYEDIYYSSRFLEGAIITYLRRNGNRVADDKNYVRGESEDFEGGYVKEPIPGRYDYIYDLDLTSMYPSIIMSLNISIETKVAKIHDWSFKKFNKGEIDVYDLFFFDEEESFKYKRDDLKEFLEEGRYTISTNGIIYRTDVVGIIPAILRDWFDDRTEYKNLMKKHGNEGNDELYEFYDKRQHIQKILLNSVYGCLGLNGWRWYDVDNALAVTSVGQEVIKFSSNIANSFYNKKLDANEDWVIYTDTDSTFLSALPMIEKMYPDIDMDDEELMCSKISEVAKEVQDYINRSYNVMAKKMFFIQGSHRFEIKQENIARRAIWVAKKRYVQKIIWENGVAKDKIDVKGLDPVRSDFPKAFKDFMNEILEDLLNGVEKDIVDRKIVKFKNNLSAQDLFDVSKPTSVKKLDKYNKSDGNLATTEKGAPAHIKASIYYNDFLKLKGLDNKYRPIRNGEKIVWGYLKENPYGMRCMSLKGYDDPEEVVDFVKKYFDYDKMFDRILKNKLLNFYDALDWTSFEGVNLHSEKFFSF